MTANEKTLVSQDVVIRKAYLDTPAGQLHYLSSSPVISLASNAPVLLLHMSASSSGCFKDLIHALSSAGYSCVAPDMPGFGNSFDPDSDPPSIAWYAELYYDAFSQFPSFGQGCHIIGHHSGGVIGIELAARHDGFCQTLTIIGPTVMTAEQRLEMSKTFLSPFNKPVPSGEHLLKTWKYLLWEGIPEDNVDLLQREFLDHVRAWRGRSQIYSCVWSYDFAASMRNTSGSCKILGLCAKDDVLWPYFENFKAVSIAIVGKEINGGNFGPDLDAPGILSAFLSIV